MQDLRGALYAHLQSMPLRFFTETRTGEIQSRLANDVGGVQAVVTDTASSVTSNLAIAISTIVAMFLHRLAADGPLARPAAVLHVPHVPRRQGPPRGLDRDPEVARRDDGADRGDAQRQRHPAVEDVRPAGELGRSSSARSTPKLATLQIRQAMVGRWFFMIIGTIFSITPAFVYWLAGWLAIQNDPTAPTIGDIVAFTTLQSRLFFPLGQLLNVQVEIQGALALFDRIFEYLEMDPEIVDAPDAVALDARYRPGPGPLPGRRRSATRPRRSRPSGRTSRRPDRTSRCPGTRSVSQWRPRQSTRMRSKHWSRRAARVGDMPAIEMLPAFALEDIDFEARAGRARRAGRPVGLGQDDDDVPDPAPVRRRHGRGRDRRHRRPAHQAGVARADHRRRDPGDVPVPRVDPREPAVRQARGDRGGAARRDPGRGDPRPDHGAARGLRHDRRRARLQAVGRREAARRDRPGAAQGPAHPHPRRGDVGARHGVASGSSRRRSSG